MPIPQNLHRDGVADQMLFQDIQPIVYGANGPAIDGRDNVADLDPIRLVAMRGPQTSFRGWAVRLHLEDQDAFQAEPTCQLVGSRLYAVPVIR